MPSSATPSPVLTATPPPRTTYTTTSQETRGAVTLVAVVHTTRYEIGGATAAEIDTAMRTWGPVDPLGGYHWFALTEPLFDWRYSCPCGEGGCVTGPVTVYLTVSYTFPRWAASSGADPALAAQWTAFEAALIEHEHGHGALAAECAWSLGEAFAALPPAVTCAALDAAVLSASQDVFATCREAQRRYEDQTDHGRTQGVIWPPG
jgi:predicted secreted Zn-dependent protease